MPQGESVIKIAHIIALLVLALCTTLAQDRPFPTEGVIEISKKSSVPVWCRDPQWRPDSSWFGSAVIVGEPGRDNGIYALTCEHVIAVKDSLDKTLRYLSQIQIGLNRNDDSTIRVPVSLVYADERRDFALLSVPDSFFQPQYSIHFKIITLNQCITTDNLREGMPAIFIGYPLRMGSGNVNQPLSRLGIISQLTRDKPHFIVDGFVQRGHSGSPVFVVKSTDTTWTRYLAGIARAFPTEYSDLLYETGLKREPGKKVLVNPGFSIITSMDVIKPKIDSLLRARK